MGAAAVEQGSQKLWGETWRVSQRLRGVLGVAGKDSSLPPRQGPGSSPSAGSLCEPLCECPLCLLMSQCLPLWRVGLLPA